MKHLAFLVFVLAVFGCSSTVTVAGSFAAAGTAGDLGFAGSTSTGGAGGIPEGAAGTDSAGASAGGSAGIDCTAPLPTSMVWNKDPTTYTSIVCANSPCWTGTFTWAPSTVVHTLSFDELTATLSVTMTLHSATGTIDLNVGSTACSLDFPDRTMTITFELARIYGGYDITRVYDSVTEGSSPLGGAALFAYRNPSSGSYITYGSGGITLGTCSSGNASAFDDITTSQLSPTWTGLFADVVIPDACVH
jgi:hypothetical protein